MSSAQYREKRVVEVPSRREREREERRRRAARNMTGRHAWGGVNKEGAA
jgi:hypothetical protein